MKHYMNKSMLAAGLLLLSMAVWADYDPDNPQEPQAYFRLITVVSPSMAGSTSGSGMYMEGVAVNVRTSASTGYTFNHWEHKRTGETLSTNSAFAYTMSNRSDTLVAVYDFTPNNPAEPDYTNQYRLYLTTNIEGACSFNRTSGEKAEADDYITVSAYVSQGYDFLGWYQNGTRISESVSFNYQMPANGATLQAMLSFNPANPDEPSATAYTATGDLNADGIVNVVDATILIGAYLQGTTVELQKSLADVNHDGTVNVVDATEVISRFLNNR